MCFVFLVFVADLYQSTSRYRNEEFDSIAAFSASHGENSPWKGGLLVDVIAAIARLNYDKLTL